MPDRIVGCFDFFLFFFPVKACFSVYKLSGYALFFCEPKLSIKNQLFALLMAAGEIILKSIQYVKREFAGEAL